MRADWDDAKSDELEANPKRGFSFEECLELFRGPYYEDMKCDDPLQWRVIGWVQGVLVTLIYESRDDDQGEYFHFVTYWRSSPEERKVYAKAKKD